MVADFDENVCIIWHNQYSYLMGLEEYCWFCRHFSSYKSIYEKMKKNIPNHPLPELHNSIKTIRKNNQFQHKYTNIFSDWFIHLLVLSVFPLKQKTHIYIYISIILLDKRKIQLWNTILDCAKSINVKNKKIQNIEKNIKPWVIK